MKQRATGDRHGPYRGAAELRRSLMSRKIAGVAPARTTAAAAGLLLAAGLAACGSGPTGSASPGTPFTYWTSQWQPAEIAAVDAPLARARPGMHARGQYTASAEQYRAK